MKRKNVTIRYYRIEPFGEDRKGWPDDGDVAGKIGRKLARAPANPYIRHREQSFIVERHDLDPLHASVSTVRHDELPLRELRGHTSALALPNDENLAEPTHVVFFGSRIVALTRGLNTPGHIVASVVLSKRTGIDLQLVPILRPEVEALVVNSVAVTSLDLRVAGNSFDAAAARAGDPVEAVRQMTSRISGAMKATVSVSAYSQQDRWRLRSFLIRQLERGFTSEDGVQAAKARVIDRDGNAQLVDLLEDQIAHGVTVETESVTRHLDADEVRKLAVESFLEQRAVLTRSIELHP